MSRTFNTILVPIDFSPYSTEALLYAASIAEPFSSSLLLLHVIAQDTKVYATHRHLERRGMPPCFSPSRPLLRDVGGTSGGDGCRDRRSA